ncbi:MAG: MFS transporter [Sulfitobacter sp.]
MTRTGLHPFFRNPLLPAIMACFCAGGLYGWSALIAPLQDRYSVSTADTGLAFSIAIVSFSSAVLILPSVFRGRSSTRQFAWFATLGAVFVLLALNAPTYVLFLIWFSGGFGAASGAIYIIALAISAQSIQKEIATPVIVASFGAGSAVFGPLWRFGGDQGWGLNGLLFLVMGLVVSALMAWQSNWRSETSSPPSSALNQDKTQSAGNRRCFLLWLTFAFGSYTGLMVLGLAAKMMDEVQMGLTTVGLTLGGIAICNTAGRLSAALLGARCGLSGCLALSFGITALGLTASFLSSEWVKIMPLGMMCVAAGYGLTASTIPLVTQSSFGPGEFQRRFAVVFTAWGVAGFCAPWIGGILFDRNGSFTPALLTATCSCLAFGLVSVLLIRDMERAKT